MRINKDRMAHMHTVAELMWLFYPEVDCEYLTREDIYKLGLNHDIGYMSGSKNHEANGAVLFGAGGPADGIFSRCIRWHGITPEQYIHLFTCTYDDIPEELILLWWADMMVEPSGENAGAIVGFDERLESIKRRHGKNSDAYKNCRATMKWICDFWPNLPVNSLGDEYLG